MRHTLTYMMLVVLVVLVVLAAADLRAGGEVVGDGDFEYFLDTATFRKKGASTDPVTEFYFRVGNTELRFKKDGGQYVARVKMNFRIGDVNGKEIIKQSEELRFAVATEEETTSPIHFQTLVKQFDLPPGSYKLSCAILDVNAPKMTIMGMMKNKYATSLIERFPLTVPAFPATEPTLSDGKFLWSVDRKGEDLVLHPNPPRIYGLYKDSLRVYLEAYIPEGLAGRRRLSVQSVILDEQGETVRDAAILLPAADAPADGSFTYPVMITEDINHFLAGTYTLYAGIAEGDSLLVKIRCGKFDVAWDMRTWESSRRSFLAEAQFLLGDEEYEEFSRASVGQQEAMLREMWQRLDPDENTGVNEAYEKFLQRMEYVNAHYSDYQLGAYTDRGLIYMRYGEPDEVIVDVIPINRESMSDAMEKVRDRFHAVQFSTSGGRLTYANPSTDVIVDPRRVSALGEDGNVAYPYELWVYNGSGQPILKRDKSIESDIGLRFIFIDREGFGRYKLESSSLMTPK